MALPKSEMSISFDQSKAPHQLFPRKLYIGLWGVVCMQEVVSSMQGRNVGGLGLSICFFGTGHK